MPDIVTRIDHPNSFVFGSSGGQPTFGVSGSAIGFLHHIYVFVTVESVLDRRVLVFVKSFALSKASL